MTFTQELAERRILNNAKEVEQRSPPPSEAQQVEAALKVHRLALELTVALRAARDLGVPLVIQVDDIPMGKRLLTQVLARMLVD
ncbi:hypothetical protein [Mesorhizobium sp. L103C119B0]|uniref:hypothetical protein n=1 Tax=Mesorhizobium sp. L103C119B0 TaxID=1287085 RepID=UPI0012DD3FA9|nr:hypothetical protein [Mesorhizobium sp. L103C119B0]